MGMDVRHVLFDLKSREDVRKCVRAQRRRTYKIEKATILRCEFCSTKKEEKR
jgi:hypothetical protein